MAYKRYTIFNLYIRGSNQSPQACHALAQLFKNKDTMSAEAQDIFNNWLSSDIEIMLQGGYHKDLEDLYTSLSNIPSLPCAKFNESMEALNGACTVVTFIANDNIVAANDYIRANRLTPYNAQTKLLEAQANREPSLVNLKYDEILVASKVAFLSLAN